MYLARGHRVNPKVLVQWGQELVELFRTRNFSYYGVFEISDKKAVFMRNIRLVLSERLYEVCWDGPPYKLTVEAFNSNTGKTSFDLTIQWFFNGELIAKLIRKMVYVSMETGKPISLPPEFVAGNPDHHPITFSLKSDPPKRAGETTLIVRPSDLDYNAHVAHPVYMDYLLDAAHTCKYQHFTSELVYQRISSIDIEYRTPVVLGKKVAVQSWDEEKDGEGLEVNFVMSQGGNLGNSTVCLGKVQLFDR